MAKELRTGQENESFRIKKLKGWFFPYGTYLSMPYCSPDGTKLKFSFLVTKHGYSLCVELVEDDKEVDCHG